MKKLIISLLLLSTVLVARSQLEVQIGAGKTELKNNAIVIGITYLKSLDSLFGGTEFFIPGKHSFFTITPEAEILTGTEDAYSSIIVKATGLFATFKTKTVAGLLTPDYTKTFNVFPASLGIEASNSFKDINAIFEVGWIPYYQSYGRGGPDWLKKTNIGFFLQTGYKFSASSVGNPLVGGELDQSEEKPDNGILRLMGSAAINTGELVNINGLKIGLVGSADVWYDVLNTAIYHKVEGRGRFFLNQTQYIDFIYAKGSGAPLFNLADQYGVGLTMLF